MRVLIAEDDRVTARLLTGLLESWGYDVLSADDGNAAMTHFESATPPQLVLLDWMLPGMEGPEVCRRIRQLPGGPAVYIVLLTSRGARVDVVAGLEAGADEYLVKPIDPDELHARLSAGARIVDLQQRLADQVRELETALANVQQLTGLLPICSYCKSIRDDSNYWHRVEEYVGEHSSVTFSHGICPKCLPKVMAEIAGE